MVLLLRDIYFIVLHLLVYSVTGLYLVAYSEAGVVFYITVYITAEGCCSKRGRLLTSDLCDWGGDDGNGRRH